MFFISCHVHSQIKMKIRDVDHQVDSIKNRNNKLNAERDVLLAEIEKLENCQEVSLIECFGQRKDFPIFAFGNGLSELLDP